ncbi:hypothetical protein [uncultured Tenacibaculum sp.]|uniref:hypothetical protein n=1 Tax=uncultured Tenacibaculum sp. TaxID=174713 RepID=UPI002625A4CA|nr:hypothetical protein [uncultured Tenacibaculum sp.]
MASYNVQNFTYDGPGDSLCYGKQDDHNHYKANKFTIDVTAYLQSQGIQNIHAGPFKSHQNKPSLGKEFKWNGNAWVKS